MQTRQITYTAGSLTCQGYYACDESSSHKKPIVLVIHDWTGCNEFAKQKAEKIAENGFIGLAIDLYGEGKNGKDNAEKNALMQPLVQDRDILLARLRAAVDVAKTFTHADSKKIAAMGFCFGGLCALDLARGSDDIAAVISVHGLLTAPPMRKREKMTAKILVLHGHDDPMVPPEEVFALEKELTTAKADWQVHVFGQTMHAFTNPLANDPAFGTVYSPVASRRAMRMVDNFLTDVFEVSSIKDRAGDRN